MKQLSLIISLLFSLTCYAHDGEKLVVSDILASMKQEDKAAILMVHFGTTHADTRALTIDAINNKVKREFSGIEIREAYTSRIVIKRLKENGIDKLNPLQALKQLHAEGYTHVLIQPSTIIDGIEIESLNRNTDEVRSLFKEIRIGEPLLYSPNDYEKVIDILATGYSKEKAYVWVGHGTLDSTTAQYAMLDYMLKAKGHTNCFVGTIEGYPEFDDMLAQLKASGLKKVVLVPFMFVAGEHAKNDIAMDWKGKLEKEGFSIEVQMQGLGENTQIQDIYISHLKFILDHKKIDIIAKKAIYEKTGEKMDSHH